MPTIDRLVSSRARPGALGRFSQRILLHAYGLDLPAEVQIGGGVVFPHLGRGTVIHPRTIIGNRVTIFHGVTVGREDAHLPEELSEFGGIEIGDDAVLFAGCVVLGGPGRTRIGQGTLVGANSVLRQSTGAWEIWAGVPARLVGQRASLSTPG